MCLRTGGPQVIELGAWTRSQVDCAGTSDVWSVMGTWQGVKVQLQKRCPIHALYLETYRQEIGEGRWYLASHCREENTRGPRLSWEDT